jgi:hypothetical protein
MKTLKLAVLSLITISKSWKPAPGGGRSSIISNEGQKQSSLRWLTLGFFFAAGSIPPLPEEADAPPLELRNVMS